MRKKITLDNSSSTKYFNKDGTIKIEFKKYINKKKIKNNGLKPVGLWYGFDDSWYNWCYDNEMPSFISNMNVYKLKIPRNLNILKIKTKKDLITFHNEYFKDDKTIYNNLKKIIPETEYKLIDWVKVKKNYDGIEFYPYIKTLIDKYYWYYSLDCSSGCIWNLENITSEYLGKLPKINKNNEENDLKKNKLKFKKLI